MRICLCISGQPRFFMKGYRNLYKSIIKSNKPDIFIHSWFSHEDINRCFQASDWAIKCSDKGVENTKDKLISLYKPKDYIIEPQNHFNIPRINEFNRKRIGTDIRGYQNVFATYSMFYSIKKSNNLKQEYEKKYKFNYDCVIRARFDLKIKPNNINFDQYNLEKINCRKLSSSPCLDDQFAFSNSKNMDIYSSVYDNLEIYFDEIQKWGNEAFLTLHLLKNNIFHTKTDIEVDIIRR